MLKHRREAIEKIEAGKDENGENIPSFEEFKDNILVKTIISQAVVSINECNSIEAVDNDIAKYSNLLKDAISGLEEEKQNTDDQFKAELDLAKSICLMKLTEGIEDYDNLKDIPEVKAVVESAINSIKSATEISEVYSTSLVGRANIINVIDKIKANALEQGLIDAKYAALDRLTNDLTDYAEYANEIEVINAKSNVETIIENCSTVESVKNSFIHGQEVIQTAINNAKERINKENLEKELANAKASAIGSLTDGIPYYDEFKNNANVINAVKNANNMINVASNVAQVETIASERKEMISKIVAALKKQADSKELKEAKEIAKENITVGIDEYEDYKDEMEVRNAYEDSINNIDAATSLEELETVTQDNTEAIKKAIEDAKARIEQELALAELDKTKRDAINSLTKDIEDYGKYKGRQVVVSTVNNGILMIEAADSIENVGVAKNNAINNIKDAIAQEKEADRKALEAAKKEAVDTFVDGIYVEPYLGNYEVIDDFISNFPSTVDAATSIEEVAEIKQEERLKLIDLINSLDPNPLIGDFYIYRSAFNKNEIHYTFDGKDFYLIGQNHDGSKLLFLPSDIIATESYSEALKLAEDSYVGFEDIGCEETRLLTRLEFNIFDLSKNAGDFNIGDGQNWWISNSSSNIEYVNDVDGTPTVSNNDASASIGVRPVYVFDAKQANEFNGKTIDLYGQLQEAIKKAKETLTDGISDYEEYKDNEYVKAAVDKGIELIDTSKNCKQVDGNKKASVELIDKVISRIKSYDTDFVDIGDFKWKHDWKFKSYSINGSDYYIVSESADGTKVGLLPADIFESASWSDANKLAQSAYLDYVDIGCESSRLMTKAEAKTALDDETRVNDKNLSGEQDEWYWWLSDVSTEQSQHYLVEYHGAIDEWSDEMELGVRPVLIFDKAQLDSAVESGKNVTLKDDIKNEKLTAKKSLVADIDSYDEFKLQDLVVNARKQALSNIDAARNIRDINKALEEGKNSIKSAITRIQKATENTVDVDGTPIRTDWTAQHIRLDGIKFYIISYNLEDDTVLLIPELSMTTLNYQRAKDTAEQAYRIYKDVGCLDSHLLSKSIANIADSNDQRISINEDIKNWWLADVDDKLGESYYVDEDGTISLSEGNAELGLRPVYRFTASILRNAYYSGETSNIHKNLEENRQKAIDKLLEEVVSIPEYETYSEDPIVISSITKAKEKIKTSLNKDEINSNYDLALQIVKDGVLEAKPYKEFDDGTAIYKDWTETVYNIGGTDFYVMGKQGDNLFIIRKDRIARQDCLWGTANRRAKEEYKKLLDFGAISSSLVSKEYAEIGYPESQKFGDWYWWTSTLDVEHNQHYIVDGQGNVNIYGGGEAFNMSYRPMIVVNEEKLNKAIEEGTTILEGDDLDDVRARYVNDFNKKCSNLDLYNKNKNTASIRELYREAINQMDAATTWTQFEQITTDSIKLIKEKLPEAELNRYAAEVSADINKMIRAAYDTDDVKFNRYDRDNHKNTYFERAQKELLKKVSEAKNIDELHEIDSSASVIITEAYNKVTGYRNELVEADGYRVFKNNPGDVIYICSELFDDRKLAKWNGEGSLAYQVTHETTLKFNIIGYGNESDTIICVPETNDSMLWGDDEELSEHIMTDAECYQLTTSKSAYEEVWSMDDYKKIINSINYLKFEDFGFDSSDFVSENIVNSINSGKEEIFNSEKPWYLKDTYEDEGVQKHYVYNNGAKEEYTDYKANWVKPLFQVDIQEFTHFGGWYNYIRQAKQYVEEKREWLNDHVKNYANLEDVKKSKEYISILKSLMVRGGFSYYDEAYRHIDKDLYSNIYKMQQKFYPSTIKDLEETYVYPTKHVNIDVPNLKLEYDVRCQWDQESYILDNELFDVMGFKDDKAILVKRSMLDDGKKYHNSDIKLLAGQDYKKYQDFGFSSSRLITYDEFDVIFDKENKKYNSIYWDTISRNIWVYDLRPDNHYYNSCYCNKIKQSHNNANYFGTLVTYEVDADTLNSSDHYKIYNIKSFLETK